MKNRGFAALISVILVSAFLMAMVLQNTNNVGVLFDEANHKQYRMFATEAALTCLDHAVLEITHDYFFTISANSSVSYSSDHCSIISVVDTAGFPSGNGHKTIIVSGNMHSVVATISMDILLTDRKISLVSEKTFF